MKIPVLTPVYEEIEIKIPIIDGIVNWFSSFPLWIQIGFGFISLLWVSIIMLLVIQYLLWGHSDP